MLKDTLFHDLRGDEDGLRERGVLKGGFSYGGSEVELWRDGGCFGHGHPNQL